MIKRRTFTADFETTTNLNYDKDGYVRVWLWSMVNVDDINECYYGKDIYSFLDKIKEQHITKVYFHNLRFDGQFILYALLELGYEYNRTFKVIVDDLGNWFEIKFACGGFACSIWDSLKKFPSQSVNSIAKLYGIAGKKDHPFWERYIPDNYEPTQDEIDYCVQDSRIIAIALGKEIANGHTAITLSADAFNDVKKTIGGQRYWREKMPLLEPEMDKFCRESYKGGWVYVNPRYQNKDLDNVTVYDVNSLYPYVMHECKLPIGEPIPTDNVGENELYIVKFTTVFDLKKKHLPTIQIKNNPYYKETEYLEYVDEPVTLTMTSVDYKLFREQYDIHLETDKQYVAFNSKVGLLAKYIDKHMQDKIDATIEGNKAKRYLAKRYMNSPYGKTGMRGNRINRIPFMDDDGVIRFKSITTESNSIYVPYASFVCANARDITIRSAQKNYDKFVYADTDSLHLIGDTPKDLDVDDVELGKWKIEGKFDKAKYIRAKTYIHGDKDYNVQEIKCAGLPEDLRANITWEQFKLGTIIDGKLMQKRVKGGCLLVPTTFEIKV